MKKLIFSLFSDMTFSWPCDLHRIYYGCTILYQYLDYRNVWWWPNENIWPIMLVHHVWSFLILTFFTILPFWPIMPNMLGHGYHSNHISIFKMNLSATYARWRVTNYNDIPLPLHNRLNTWYSRWEIYWIWTKFRLVAREISVFGYHGNKWIQRSENLGMN